jgi:hypothetical protein
MEHFEKIINGPQGIIFIVTLFLAIIALLGFFVFFILRLKNFHFKTKNGNEAQFNANNSDSSVNGKLGEVKAIAGGKYVKIDMRTYKNLIEFYNITSQEFNSKAEIIKDQLDLKIKFSQKQCIDRAIDTLNLDYAIKQKEEKEKVDSSLTILELYLKVDMNEILKQELLTIEQDERLFELTEDEVQKKLESATDTCIRKLKLRANKYIMVNKDIFIPLLESETNALRDNLYETIKAYQRASKEEKQAIDVAIEEKQKILEERIKNLFDVIDVLPPH